MHLYDNGRLVWSAVRGKGKRIPSGGTLILGREQDCVGGCFDSRAGMLTIQRPPNEHESKGVPATTSALSTACVHKPR